MLTAAIGIVGAAILHSGDGGRLQPTAPTLVYGGVVLKPSQAFTIGDLQLEHPGKEIRVTGVEALMSPNVTYLGAFTVWPRDFRRNKLGVGRDFPAPQLSGLRPLGEPVPAAQTSVVLPGAAGGRPAPMQVVVGFRLVSGDIGAVNGIRIAYTVDGKARTAEFRQAAVVCRTARVCEEAGVGDDDFDDRILRQFKLLPEN
ncbi:MAG: hypothetical protein ACT4PP_11025 [Sporichthyaceae bacterium]